MSTDPSINPYESPLEAAIVDEQSSEELIRLKHVNLERSVRSIGLLFYISGGFCFLASLSVLGMPSTLASSLIWLTAFFAIGFIQVATGRALRRFRPWSRIVGMILIVPGLLGFPLGTLIAAYLLYVLGSKKGAFLFTEEYARIRAATRHLNVRLKTSPVVLVLAWLLLALLLLGLVGLLVPLFVPT